MTAVANPPSFGNISRPGWGMNGGHMAMQLDPDDLRSAAAPRKAITRTNSASSLGSTTSTSSTSTAVLSANPTANALQSAAGDLSGWTRKRPIPKAQPNGMKMETGSEAGRGSVTRSLSNGVNGVSGANGGQQMQSTGKAAPSRNATDISPPVPAALYLLSLNGTFERKTISIPTFPDTMRIGRQTNARTVPTPMNGYFDSKVLSRAHAEVWTDQQGKIWIRDVKSSNGTFINGTRLSQENRESEPHEIQTGDHLELGIDIVSEDQKQVVHHKVAAKVEHAGLVPNTGGLLDINFGDLDPANSSLMMPMGTGPIRGRAGSHSSAASSGRMSGMPNPHAGQGNGLAYNRNLVASSMTTEFIVKKLRNEMRNARQQAQDIGRTSKFLDALLSPEDVKEQEKLEMPDLPRAPSPPPAPPVNGASFRSEGKARFSDPPAPPPSQPLPDKPDMAKINGLDKAERPRSFGSQASPIRHDSISQIIQLTEAVNLAKREIDTQSAKIRDLEEALTKEREARNAAEEAAKRLEDDVHAKTNGHALEAMGTSEPAEGNKAATCEDTRTMATPPESHKEPQTDQAPTSPLQIRLDSMMNEMRGLKEQVELYKQQAEQATSERDADRQSLAEMIIAIRKKDEEVAAHKAALKSHKRSRSGSRGRSKTARVEENGRLPRVDSAGDATINDDGDIIDDPSEEAPTLSRANTITPTSRSPALRPSNQTLIETVPYATMMGVVLLGMGLMAYLNGWQPPPQRADR